MFNTMFNRFNTTCLIGLIPFCLTSIKSKRSLIVAINGILYHTNPSNTTLRNWDITCNTIMISYTVYNYNQSRIFAFMGTTSFIINSYFASDIIHVLGVQIPLFFALSKTLC